MSLFSMHDVWQRLTWPWDPKSNREAGSGIVANFLLHWFPNRVSLRSLAFSYSLYLGIITFVVFLILVVTGVVLMFLYVPSVERAYWSIKDIDAVVSFGWLLRRLHRVSAHAMVALVFLHMFRVFLTGSYKAGDEIRSARPFNWVLGVSLLVLTLLLSFTGYLLPWDQLAYWAITVGTNIAASVPAVGETIRQFLLGGTVIGQPTLIRFYVLHCALAAAGSLRGRDLAHVADPQGRRSRDCRTGSQGRSRTGPRTTEEIEDLQRPRHRQRDDRSGPRPDHVERGQLAAFEPRFSPSASSSQSSSRWRSVPVCRSFSRPPSRRPPTPTSPPTPAKAPWYFLGLQEMVGYSALMGGVIIPTIVIFGLMLIPFLDREQRGIGFWFTDGPGRRWGIVDLSTVLP